MSGLKDSPAVRWAEFDASSEVAEKSPLVLDPCATDQDTPLLSGQCTNHYDCNVAGIGPVAGTSAQLIWQNSTYFPTTGQCLDSVRRADLLHCLSSWVVAAVDSYVCNNQRASGTELKLGNCNCGPNGIAQLNDDGLCKLRFARDARRLSSVPSVSCDLFCFSVNACRPGRCRSDEQCSPPYPGATPGYCFTEAGVYHAELFA